MKTTLRLVIEKFSTLRQTPTLTKKEIVFEITLQLNVEVTFARIRDAGSLPLSHYGS